jgi:hypothetical protein
MNPDHRTLLENYVTPNLPGSLTGFESFFRSLKERGVVVKEDKRSKRVDERKQHVYETSVRTETVSN